MNTRITNSTVLRRYNDVLQRNFKKKNDAENKIISQRKFTRASQSPMDAAKALRNRKAISEAETYKKNLETATSIYDSAEEAVRGVSGILQTLQEKLILGAHGTFSVETDKQILAEEVNDLADQMVRLMNLVVADRRIFGGVNNTDQPYKIERGSVFYNGVSVNSFSDPTMFPDSTVSYLDAGLGMRFLEDGYTIDPQSAIPVTFNGAQMLGCGYGSVVHHFDMSSLKENAKYTLDVTLGDETFELEFTPTMMNDPDNPGNTIVDRDATATSINHQLKGFFGDRVKLLDNGTFEVSQNIFPLKEFGVKNSVNTANEIEFGDYKSGFPSNIIQLTLDAAKSIQEGTDDLTALYADLIFEAGSHLSLSIASIGTEQAFIEFNLERLTNNTLGLLERENELEYADMGEEITNQKVLEMIYNATMQMSASVIPMSIFNFIN